MLNVKHFERCFRGRAWTGAAKPGTCTGASLGSDLNGINFSVSHWLSSSLRSSALGLVMSLYFFGRRFLTLGSYRQGRFSRSTGTMSGDSRRFPTCCHEVGALGGTHKVKLGKKRSKTNGVKLGEMTFGLWLSPSAFPSHPRASTFALLL